MKKNILHKTLWLWPLAATLALGSCIEEEMPSDVAVSGQLEGSSSSFESLVRGLNSKMISLSNYYGSSSSGTYAATQDWGHPCYLYLKETLLDGFPNMNASWNYQHIFEAATGLTGYVGCPFYYYYGLIDNANRILAAQDESTASELTRQYLGITRVYRALGYMELTSMFEFLPTQYEELNAKAAGVMGLTVPLVTEDMTLEEKKNNPRVPFYTMYRFIYGDLAKAEEMVRGYHRARENEVNIDVVNGLMARFWLTLATRFRLSPADLALQVEHEGDADRGADLGITTAEECYRRASLYAGKVINAGYTPVTKAQWQDPKTGFNTANQAWVWDMSFTSQEQFSDFWCTIMGNIASEPIWGMPNYGGAYRCITPYYYNKMQPGDWRKDSWIAPEDAGAVTVPARYNSLLKDENPSTLADGTNFSRLPAYANIKFRPGSGNVDDLLIGLLCDIPIIRVEEMHFINIECDFFLQGFAAGRSALENFLNTYRFDAGSSYTCPATDADNFIYEMIAQKYVEFWGEGVLYNDFKRLRLAVSRLRANTNYLEVYQLESKDGYCAPWLNFFLPNVERNFNKGVEGQMNPDTTPYCK